MYEVTIAIPIYQVEEFIESTMNSALSQSFQSIEYLIIDDCGKDNSLNIIENIKLNHPRGENIHIIKTDKNSGIAVVRNLAIDHAKGKYLYFLDGDDEISEDCIELLHDFISKYNADFVSASYQKNELNGHISCREYEELRINRPNLLAKLHYKSQSGLLHGTMWNILYDVHWLRKNNIKCNPGTLHEEPDFLIQLITHTNSCYLLPDITYFYKVRNNSATQKQRTMIPISEIESHIKSLDFRKNYAITLKQKAYFPELAIYIMRNNFKDASIYISAPLEGRFSNHHLKKVLELPFGIDDIIKFNHYRLKALSFYLFFKFPIPIQRFILKSYIIPKRLWWKLKKHVNSKYQ